MSVNINEKKYIFIVSTSMMCILLCFNHNKIEFTFEELKIQTNLPEKLLMNTLYSLSCVNPSSSSPKYQMNLLLKFPKNQIINNGDKFILNNSFHSNSKRINIPLITNKI